MSLVDVHAPLPLLGGLSPLSFMRRHWQRKPLLVRQAWPAVAPPLPRAGLFALAARDDVESRLVQRQAGTWAVQHGPFTRRRLPPLSRRAWTLLVQGLDLHVPAAHEMLAQFSFLPAARLDDLMVSWASAGGGVGPHADSYDVFLVQVQGQRRWRVAPPGDNSAFVDGLPLKILARFEPQHDWLLEPGDMLYLPPRWGHDGVAEGGECMTCSVGLRAPSAPELARELLQRIADGVDASDDDEATRGSERLYTDATQPATRNPGAVPRALSAFAARAVAAALRDPQAIARALGETLSEPKPRVWFDAGARLAAGSSKRQWPLRLDARTRMLYDAKHIFINGESYRAAGLDARILRRLADERALPAGEAGRLSEAALACLQQWAAAGWLHAVHERGGPADSAPEDLA